MASKRPKPAAFAAFISHAKADAKKARAIAEGLEARGFRCWIAPRDVKAGRTYGDEIIRGIESAKVFILVLSKASNESAFVAREVERAVSKKKPLLAVRIADVEPGPALELFVASTQWIDAFPGRLAPSIDRLAERLAEEEGIEPPAAENESRPPDKLPKWSLPAAAALSVLVLLGAGIALWSLPAPQSRGGNGGATGLTATPVREDGTIEGNKDGEDQAMPADPDFRSCEGDSGEAAIAACDRAIYSNKFGGRDLAQLYNGRGYLYMTAGDLARARADLDRAIRIDPNLYHPYWNRAEILRREGDREAALADYRKALALGPSDGDKIKIEGSLAALASEATTEPHDRSVITKPTWNNPEYLATHDFPFAADQAMPTAPAAAAPPPMPAAPSVDPAR